MPGDQLELALEDVEQAIAEVRAGNDAINAPLKAVRAARRRANRGALPAHLPRIEVVVEPESLACPCCGGQLHKIGEDVAERLDIIPAQFRVIVTSRPKYACRGCTDGVVQAPAPARLIEGGLPTEAIVAHVLVAKYADHLPLVPPGADLRPARHRARPLDAGRLGRQAAAELRPVISACSNF